MRHTPPQVSPCRYRTRRRVLAGLAAMLAFALGSIAPAAADCADCPGPSERELQRQPGFELLDRWGPFGIGTDYVETDGGECRLVIEEDPIISKTGSWLALRATGEVWNCPHGTSSDRVVIETRHGDSTSWAVTSSFHADASAVLATFRAHIESSRTVGASITEVTRVEKRIDAASCLRIAWQGYLEIAQYEARAQGRIERRWAWWTKNIATGSSVHAKGDVWVVCERGNLLLSRRAPIAGVFHLTQRSCEDDGCEKRPPRDLGWFPDPPIQPPPSPVTTPSAVDEDDSPVPATPTSAADEA